MLRVLDQISGFEDGARLLACCAGLRETLLDSTTRHPSMDELARHISSNLPAGVEPVADVKAPARVAARIKAEDAGETAKLSSDVCLDLYLYWKIDWSGRCSCAQGGGGG